MPRSDDDKVGPLTRRRRRTQRRILRSTAAVPSLVTLGNGLAGFASIHFATKTLQPDAHNLVIAAWLLFVGMICDAMDGQLARMTRRTSDFGKQLDSLCDVVSFGVAPAILTLRAVQGVLFPYVGEVDVLPQAALAGRAVWFIAAMYVCCAIMRLARFNVETEPDVASHMVFKGLPSPAAALSVTSLVLLHAHLQEISDTQPVAPWLAETVVWSMPVVTLITALLMVSRLRFPHLVNQYLRGRKSFRYILTLAILVLAAVVMGRQIALAAGTILYIFSGPTHWVWEKIRRNKANRRVETERPTDDRQQV